MPRSRRSAPSTSTVGSTATPSSRRFTASDVSSRDYFHPSVAGQAKLAHVSWTAGYDFGDQTGPVSTASVVGGVLTLAARDDRGVRGVEFRTPGGPWARYTAPVPLAPGQVVEYRAVDVNGNIEASHSITG